MRIVLCESTHTRQAVQFATLFIAEYSSKLCNTEWKVFIRAWLVSKYLTMVRTVHWFKHIFLVLLWSLNRLKGILAIMCIVSRRYIEIFSTNTWCYNFLIGIRTLQLTKYLLQAETNLSSLGQPDGEALAYPVRKHEKFHFFSYLAMVALLCLLQHEEILVQHLLLRERDTINTCQLVTLGITTPKGTGYTCQFHGFDSSCGHKMRTATQVGEISL